jgi:predicted DNA-binding transcriptional regulator AlpA
MSSNPEIMTEKEAAQFLRLSPRTLQRLRLDGGGPPVFQLTERRLAYGLEDLRNWLASRSRASTSAATVAAEPCGAAR